MTYQQTCPRRGEDFLGDDAEQIADAVVDHAATAHQHRLDRHIVLAHLEGIHPRDREP